MIVRYDPIFLKKLKKMNVLIRKNFKERLEIFIKNPYDLKLNNHPLKRNYLGYRSIDITSDWRAIYKEEVIGEETVAYFIAIGTHSELYGKSFRAH